MKDKGEFLPRRVFQLPRAWPLWLLLGAVLLALAFYFDETVKSWIATHQVPALKSIMRGVSRWGDWPTHVAVGAIAGGIAYLKKRRRWVAIFAAMVIACTVAGTANRLIKVVAGRARPSVETDTGWKGFRFSSRYNAFASGHTASSTAFFVPLCFARRRLGLALLPIPVLIAAARIYVNAHYLSDVVAGALIGIISAILVWRFVSAWMDENIAARDET